jgi:ElaB/YqjD/DUF883 family membrane-anchored ribosome-binding protein
MTKEPPILTYTLEEVLTRFEQKVDRQFTEIDRKIDKQFAEVNQRLEKSMLVMKIRTIVPERARRR